VAFLEGKEAHITYKKPPARTDKYSPVKYFRDSTIYVAENNLIITSLEIYKTLKRLGFEVNPSFGCVSYKPENRVNIRAFYEIQDGFDVSQLDGPTWFRDGLLVERVLVEKAGKL